MYFAIHYGGFDMKTGRKIDELGPHICSIRKTHFSRNLEISVYNLTSGTLHQHMVKYGLRTTTRNKV